ncbi:MAG: threonine synthase [Muribaculaceae bacterium]|nr:threonine synthase [Muribaculaceae bacterium]
MAADGGLFMPENLPIIPKAFFNNISEMSLREIAYVVMSTFFGDDFPGAELKTIVDESFGTDIPLAKAGDFHIMELFHGPTLTFKDYGARFMARLVRAVDRRADYGHRKVLVATTGNTGAATANGMHGLPGIDVYVLFPKGQISRARRSTFTSLGGNIHPVEVMGTIEDCKQLMQQALSDPDMGNLCLTGANSINIGRLLPQVVFAFHAYARLKAMGVPDADKAIHSIPCGNLSNLVAAAMAMRMGLPMGGILAATNSNDGLRRLLAAGTIAEPADSPVHTLAPGMDMAYPSGWPRLRKLLNDSGDQLAGRIHAAAPVDDKTIADTILEVNADHSYLLDPHSAVAYAAARREMIHAGPVLVYATGHPSAQLDTMTRITGAPLELPVQMTRFMKQNRHSVPIPPRYPALRKILLS